MLERADAELAPAGEAPPPAPLTLTVEQFPGLCMGASMLVSLSLNKIGFDPLTEKEGESLTNALLKNAMAWDIGGLIANPRAAAALDLMGVFVAVLAPRIVADAAKRKPPTEIQAAAERQADALASAA